MRKSFIMLLTSLALCGCFDTDDYTATDNSDDSSLLLGNSAPSITGSPPSSILFDNMYAFQPGASDADGDLLSFQVANGPTWASFDTSSGRLSGQPSLANIGTYQNIVISVSDGISSDSLAAFTISVTQSADGNITLSWVAPSQNADGSALVDLAGYTIHYGKLSGSYDTEIRIDNPSVTTYVVDQLSPDTYYFATTAYNSQGVDSPYSGEAVGTVN
jgi:hypothetical protein